MLTLLRFPLAALFAFAGSAASRLVIVVLAGGSDLADGVLARRFGATRIGALLDPVADKVFILVGFLSLAGRHLLQPLELVAVLARDIVVVVGFVAGALRRRPLTVPARAGGKAVTVCQMLTLVACIVESPLAPPLAWVTGAVSCYAIWDYGRVAARATS